MQSKTSSSKFIVLLLYRVESLLELKELTLEVLEVPCFLNFEPLLETMGLDKSESQVKSLSPEFLYNGSQFLVPGFLLE